MDKRVKLAELEQAWQGCRLCENLCDSRTNVVFGYGNPNAQIMILGEAPWTAEDYWGLPFVGAAGQTLDTLLASVSADYRLTGEGTDPVTQPQERRLILLEEYYYCNLIMCKPSGERPRPPTATELGACRPRLWEQIYIIDPLLIIGTGAVVLHALGGRGETITNKAGDVLELVIPGRIIPVLYGVMPILHPSFLLRQGTVHSKEFTQTYNQLSKAKQIIDTYNYEMFDAPPPPNQPVSFALTPEERNEELLSLALVNKLKQRHLLAAEGEEANVDAESSEGPESSTESSADPSPSNRHAPRYRTDEPDHGEDWADGDDPDEEG